MGGLIPASAEAAKAARSRGGAVEPAAAAAAAAAAAEGGQGGTSFILTGTALVDNGVEIFPKYHLTKNMAARAWEAIKRREEGFERRGPGACVV